MSLTRNRSQSNHSPHINLRALQQHLQGAQDAMKAFDDINRLVQFFSQQCCNDPLSANG
jgi:hypothetical protein